MIQARISPNAPNDGLQLGDQTTGCCLPATTECLYKFQFATTPATFSAISIDGVSYAFVHTYTTPEELYLALIETLTKPVNAGGAGLVVPSGDLKIYLDSFSATADRLTIEMVSGIVIDSFTTNIGTQNSATAACTKQTMCVHRIAYTLSDPIDLVIGNTQLTLTTYATVALLRTAVQTQITAEGLDSVAKAVVRAGVVATVADLWIYTKSGTPVYHNDELVQRGKCSAQYIV